MSNWLPVPATDRAETIEFLCHIHGDGDEVRSYRNDLERMDGKELAGEWRKVMDEILNGEKRGE